MLLKITSALHPRKAYLKLGQTPCLTGGPRPHITAQTSLGKYVHVRRQRRHFTTEAKAKDQTMVSAPSSGFMASTTTIVVAAGIFYVLYEQDLLQPLPPTKSRERLRAERIRREKNEKKEENFQNRNLEELAALPNAQAQPALKDGEDGSAWNSFTSTLESFASIKDVAWEDIQSGLTEYILPDWARSLQIGRASCRERVF